MRMCLRTYCQSEEPRLTTQIPELSARPFTLEAPIFSSSSILSQFEEAISQL